MQIFVFCLCCDVTGHVSRHHEHIRWRIQRIIYFRKRRPSKRHNLKELKNIRYKTKNWYVSTLYQRTITYQLKARNQRPNVFFLQILNNNSWKCLKQQYYQVFHFAKKKRNAHKYVYLFIAYDLLNVYRQIHVWLDIFMRRFANCLRFEFQLNFAYRSGVFFQW